MKNRKTLPYLFTVAIILAISLLTLTTVAGASAVPNQQSGEYQTDMQMLNIAVSIEESTDGTTWSTVASEAGKTGTAFSSLSGKQFDVGETYKDQFRISNSGKIDEYVRVVIYKYWVDAKGEKDFTGNADMIELVVPANSGWILDKKNSTSEKKIYFYTKPLTTEGEGKLSKSFLEGLRLNGAIKSEYTVSESEVTIDGVIYKTKVYNYKYNDRSFKVEIEADAVQTHHAVDAIKSAWGRDVSVAEGDGTLSLN